MEPIGGLVQMSFLFKGLIFRFHWKTFGVKTYWDFKSGCRDVYESSKRHSTESDWAKGATSRIISWHFMTLAMVPKND